MTKPDWYDFQEEICDYFLALGAEASTNERVQGVRTHHDIDVLIKTRFLGIDLTWVVEAKKWKSKVGKLQVLGLRQIVDDIGADKGFIICSSGFQSGAIDAAENSNVSLLTFDELKDITKGLAESEILKAYKQRIRILDARYWSHTKRIRREYNLRGELFDYPVYFSGATLIMVAEKAIKLAEEKQYPIPLDTGLIKKEGDLSADNFQQLVGWLNSNLNMMDLEIIKAESAMQKNGDFNPTLGHKMDLLK
ncbi:MAG: restriction endonuclease [Marinomonas sp.]